MSQTEPDYEVFEFAIYREQQAYDLYTTLANRAGNPVRKKLFEDLAAEELEHKAKLELELMKLGFTVDTTEPPAPVFAEPAESTDNKGSVNDMDYQEVLELCISKEDFAFRLYANMLTNSQSEATRETLMQLMQEEIRHKLRFVTEYENLMKYMEG